MDKERNFEKGYAEDFLDDVAEQIAYKPLRPAVVKELKDHIEDRAEEYQAEGLSRSQAVKKAVDAMGDGVSIGTEINAVRHVRTDWLLVALTALLLAAGLTAETVLAQIPELSVRGIRFYLAGVLLLVLIVYKGYPFLIRHQKPLLVLAAVLFSLEAVLFRLMKYNLASETVREFLFLFPFPWSMLDYYAFMLTGPVAVILLYRLRKHAKKAMAAALLLTAAAFFLHYSVDTVFTIAQSAGFLFSMIGTLLFMIRRDIFSGDRKKLWSFAAAGSLALLLAYALLPGQAWYFHAFVNPDAVARSTWDDAYNGVLIQELLSRAPVAGSISLTQEELMEYGTGEWYFSSGDARQAAAEGKKPFSAARSFPFHKDTNTVALWDILPQHYANNYLLAVSILRFGWLFGIALLAAVAAFYAVLFSCIYKIRGALAGAVAFHCGLCLLFQSLFYILGNFGFQYGSFTNLPLISEGRLSIMVNMLLLGFIFSAYRYDQVIDAPVCRYAKNAPEY